MITYLVISDSRLITTALAQVVKCFADSQPGAEPADDVHGFSLPESVSSRETMIAAYSRAHEWIDSFLGHGSPSRRVMACANVAVSSMADFDPINRSGAAAVLGMLILSFPDIEWVIGSGAAFPLFAPVSIPLTTSSANGDGEKTYVSQTFLTALNHLKSQHVPLFDGNGLRDALYRVIGKANSAAASCAPWLPIRDQIAVAIDDEDNYAVFNAYVAYRFGFRSYAVSTHAMMDALLIKADVNPSVAFEDLFLNFSDRASEQHLSALTTTSNSTGRDELYPKLKDVSLRLFTTSGNMRSHGDEIGTSNETYLKQHWTRLTHRHLCGKRRRPIRHPSNTASGRWWSVLFKPFSGVYDFFRLAGLEHYVREQASARQWSYVWPPAPAAMDLEKPDHHSCPGSLLLVASKLIERAKSRQGSIQNVMGAVHCATLCVVANELLGCKTPTVALEAVALRHVFETLAECQFYGVQSEFDVKARLDDIQEEVERIGESFAPSCRGLAVLNGQAAIVDRLVSIFNDQNQFDEEMTCLNRARGLHTQIRYRLYKGPNRKASVACALRWLWAAPAFYLNWIMQSLGNLLVAIVLWILGLSLAFSIPGWMSHTRGVVTAFMVFSGETPLGMEDLLSQASATALANPAWAQGVMIAGMIGGLFHLGVFISHLYSVASRR